jgi:hypothetical protein
MPSQVVEAIDELFPHAKGGVRVPALAAGDSSSMAAIVELVRQIPGDLITVSPEDYSSLVLAINTMEMHMKIWIARGPSGHMKGVKGIDAITVIRRVLSKCSDEHPPASIGTFLFIPDGELRDSVRRDVGAASRALEISEWKAATVLAGAAMEALLLWAVQKPDTQDKLAAAITAAVRSGTLQRPPPSNSEEWSLAQYIEVAAELGVIRAETVHAARLATNFRNLIHPGREMRAGQICNRATALSAIAALEHVINELSI